MRKSGTKKQLRKPSPMKKQGRKPRKTKAVPGAAAKVGRPAPKKVNSKRIPKPFELNVLGLFRWKTENWTVAEIRSIMAMVMIFIIIIIVTLKIYALQAFGTLGAPAFVNKAGTVIKKVFIP